MLINRQRIDIYRFSCTYYSNDIFEYESEVREDREEKEVDIEKRTK